MAMQGIELTMGMRQNLYQMQSTASLMDRTSTRLSTGKKVVTALDDPINFFAAQGHQQRSADLAVRKDEMGEAIQNLKAATNGIEAITNLISQAKSLAQSSLSADTTTERTVLESQFNAVLSQIDTLSADSGYKGINMLADSATTLKVRFDETGAQSNITLVGFNSTAGHNSSQGLKITNALSWDSGSASTQETMINKSIDLLDSARTTLRTEQND